MRSNKRILKGKKLIQKKKSDIMNHNLSTNFNQNNFEQTKTVIIIVNCSCGGLIVEMGIEPFF